MTETTHFHPLIARWFAERVGVPTDVQRRAWPRIASGEHVLITAPTGSGKTLAAFLWAINQLATGTWAGNDTRVLYVSPLKALNNDVQRNLTAPLAEIRERFAQAGDPLPEIRVLTRSGDTDQSERQRLVRRPPEILITTPESLNLLLSSPRARAVLRGVRSVILDEIHAVAGTRRGSHLITAVDRVALLSGEFQRVALSATVRPLESIAAFVGGATMSSFAPSCHYAPRPVAIVASADTKQLEIRVRYPDRTPEAQVTEPVLDPIVEMLSAAITRNRSTLVFTNSRKMCEKITHKINRRQDDLVAYAHHGSLSRELRAAVEAQLKAGELRAIVATSSLELGIDVGVVDEVALIQTPPTVSSAIQRIGRAGHRIGEVSRGVLYATHPLDLIEAAALAPAVSRGDIEDMPPIEAPLDVLAQVVVSMTAVDEWGLDELYAWLRSTYPYRNLSRNAYDLVLNMLAGRYADTRVRELQPRVAIDGLERKVRARPGALQAVYASGGTIPDRGYFLVRHAETNARIGELDEEFVWEARIGQIMTLGTQNWRVERMTHSDVFVTPAHPRVMATPFWRAEERGRDAHLSDAVGRLLEEIDGRLAAPGLAELLTAEQMLDAVAARELVDFLREQQRHTSCRLPHRHHVVVERIGTGPGGAPGNQVVIHTLWGAKVNRPYALALDAAWEEAHGQQLEVFVGDDCIVLQLPLDGPEVDPFGLVPSARVENLLRRRLEGSGFFGARFRECAGRALLLSRGKIGQRMPLWMSRLRAKRLLDAVSRREDFPILLETWRTCLRDELDLPRLLALLGEIEVGICAVSEVKTSTPSPLARGATWRQIDRYMYAGDEAAGGVQSRLRGDLLREIAFTPGLRPLIPAAVVGELVAKRQRLWPGYAPSEGGELLELVKERLAIPDSEWRALLAAVAGSAPSDGEGEPAMLDEIGWKLARVRPPHARETLVVARECLGAVARALWGTVDMDAEVLRPLPPGGRPIAGAVVGAPVESAPPKRGGGTDDGGRAELLCQWLSYLGPTAPSAITAAIGISSEALVPLLDELAESRRIVRGALVQGGDDDLVCEAETYEILLRLTRRAGRVHVEPLPIEHAQLWLARHQGLLVGAESADSLDRRLEQLHGYSAAAELWEGDLLPARCCRGYQPAWLDEIVRERGVVWVGTGQQTVTFCSDADRDLLSLESGSPPALLALAAGASLPPLPQLAGGGEVGGLSADELLPQACARYDLATLAGMTGRPLASVVERLWDATWRGQVTNDTVAALRKGIAGRFAAPSAAGEDAQGGQRHGRARDRRRATPAFPGSWYRLPPPERSDDPIDREERNKERVRRLLERYGVLFRELLQRESPAFQWRHLFRTLRLMELSGEVVAGVFFNATPGPQFASPQAIQELLQPLPADAICWFSAVDPASLCGIGLDSLRGTLPARRATTHVVVRGHAVALVSESCGKRLSFALDPGDPALPACLAPLRHILAREVGRVSRIRIETINDGPAARSPFVEPLRAVFDLQVETTEVVIWSRWT